MRYVRQDNLLTFSRHFRMLTPLFFEHYRSFSTKRMTDFFQFAKPIYQIQCYKFGNQFELLILYYEYDINKLILA